MNENTWGSRGNTPLSVWGPGEQAPDQPSGTADITNQLSTAFATNTHIRRDLIEHLPGGGITFQTTEITAEGVVYQNSGVTVTAFQVDHGVVKPAYTEIVPASLYARRCPSALNATDLTEAEAWKTVAFGLRVGA